MNERSVIFNEEMVYGREKDVGKRKKFIFRRVR